MFNDNSLTQTSVKDILIYGIKDCYRPVWLLLLKAEFFLFEANPIGYNVVNLFLFYLLGLFTFLILRNLSKNHQLSFLATCLFITHPIHSLLINYKTGACLILFALFMQISTFLFLKFTAEHKKTYYFLALISYLLALLCHEISFILPLYLLLILYFSKESNLKKNVLYLLPFVIPFALYLWIRLNIAGSIALNGVLKTKLSFNQYFNTFTNLIFWYISKLFYPKNILLDWDEPIAKNTFLFWNWLFWLILLSFLIFNLWKGRKDLKAFSFNLFIVGFIPITVSSFTYTPLIQTAYIAPHWMTFPLMGFFLLLACVLLSIKKHIPLKLWYIMIFCLLATSIFLTRTENKKWEGESTYSLYWIKANPINASPWLELGRIYTDNTPENKGISTFTQFDNYLKEKKNYLSYYRRGLAYHTIGEVNLAIKDYHSALELNPPHDTEYHFHKAVIYYYEKRYDLAVSEIRSAIKITPGDAALYNNLGTFLSGKGDTKEAEKAFLRAIKINPGLIQAKRGLTALYLKTGEIHKLIVFYNKIILKESRNWDTFADLSRVYLDQKRYKQAKKISKIALLKCRNSKILNELGELYSNHNLNEIALEFFEKTLKLDPKNSLAYLESGKIALKFGLSNEAIKLWTTGKNLSPGNKLFQEYINKTKAVLKQKK
ncbi:MAG: tetratricopeptide repeat protein [Candidatus Omnitrophica bacterium]|nr:tetratricopeptide repeat protein [Candidatus Omnitrophota bacterium]